MNLIGRMMMTLPIVLFTVVPPFADLATNTHVFHDGWMPHARMHTVWLLGTTSLVGALALFLLWGPRRTDAFARNVAGAIGVCVYGGFLVSAATVPLYGGALSDVVGGFDDRILGLDANLVSFSVASLILVTAWIYCARHEG